MPEVPKNRPRNPSWSRNLLRAVVVCGGCVAMLLPAWLPNRPSVPIEQGAVDLLQALLLAAAAAMMLGAAPHPGGYRQVCRVLALGFLAAWVGLSITMARRLEAF